MLHGLGRNLPQLSWQLYRGDPSEMFCRFTKLRSCRFIRFERKGLLKVAAEAVDAARAVMIHVKATIVNIWKENRKSFCKYNIVWPD